MPLDSFIDIPDTAIAGGAPIDAFQARAFRENDLLFQQLLLAMMSSPLVPSGVDNIPANPQPHQIINAMEINLTSDVTLNAKVPLIWFARKSITISARIIGEGKGAQGGEDGDFGGSGGGGSGSAGGKCVLPISGVEMFPGGANSTAAGTPLNADWASRALAFLAACTGGAGGGNPTGGAGGGVVFLCAPTITIAAGGEIDVKGLNGTAGGGGGGGGLIVLIGKDINAPDAQLKIDGGTGGGAGGEGYRLIRRFT